MPTNRSAQTQMNTMQGLYAGLNSNGQIEEMAWTPKIVAKTAAYTCKASESGTIFTDYGATATVVFTLPAISDGPFYFKFLVCTDTGITVSASTADTLIAFNDVAADSVGLVTTGEAIGGVIEVFCDGTIVHATTPIVSDAVTVTVGS